MNLLLNVYFIVFSDSEIKMFNFSKVGEIYIFKDSYKFEQNNFPNS